MALIDKLMSRRSYLDSNVFIYAFEDYTLYPDCAEIVRGIVANSIEAVTSEIAFLEILPKPINDGRTDLAEAYLKTMSNAAGLTLAPVSRNIILRAISLRAAARLNSLDAIHIATALDDGCDFLVTNDLRMRPPPELSTIYLQPRPH